MTPLHSRLFEIRIVGQPAKVYKGSGQLTTKAKAMCRGWKANVSIYDTERAIETHLYRWQDGVVALYKRDSDAEPWRRDGRNLAHNRKTEKSWSEAVDETERKLDETPRPTLYDKLFPRGAETEKTNEILRQMNPRKIILDYLTNQIAGVCVAYGMSPISFYEELRVKHAELSKNETVSAFVETMKKQKETE